jgi:hypothetical protein
VSNLRLLSTAYYIMGAACIAVATLLEIGAKRAETEADKETDDSVSG